MLDEKQNTHYMNWIVIALLDFVTIISFENIFYPFQNQGLSVVISWIFLLFTYVIPYALIATQLGLTFQNQDGGLASWIRRGTHSDLFGYITSWMYWTQTIPYLVDVSNSVIVSLSWIILGNDSLGQRMSTFTFGMLTFAIILFFIIFENLFRDSLEVLSIIGGGAMFLISVLFVFMTVWALTHGAHPATHLSLHAFKPSFSLHYFSTTGLLIFAMSGAELAAPYISKMRNPKREFPKAMWLLAIMTGFITIFGTLALSVFFDANHIPSDFKMNGPYRAFHLLGEQVGMGKSLMYLFAFVQLFFMLAQLAILIDAASRVFASDTATKYMPTWLTKKNKDGRPVHSYTLTAGISLLLLLLSGTLPNINAIYNWLLNLNGIVSPYKTALVFVAFLAIRWHEGEFNSDYVYISNRRGALAVGWWCFIFTFICATMGFIPQDAAVGTHAFNHQLLMNFLTVGFLIVLGFLLPYLRKLEMKKEA